jgi:hypothetical protein
MKDLENLKQLETVTAGDKNSTRLLNKGNNKIVCH